MTVREVWGRIQAQDVVAIAHEGDEWLFQVPRSVLGRVVAEFWVEDEAGNIGYRAALLTIEHGTIKCIEWLKVGDLTALPVNRPMIEPLEADRCTDVTVRISLEDVSIRPICQEQPHICPKMEG